MPLRSAPGSVSWKEKLGGCSGGESDSGGVGLEEARVGSPGGRVKNWGILGWEWGCRKGRGPTWGMRSETTIVHSRNI